MKCVILAFALFTAASAEAGVLTDDKAPRRTVWDAISDAISGTAPAGGSNSSPFTLGTFLGAGTTLFSNPQYVVDRNNIVRVLREDSAETRLVLGSYILPSILVARPKTIPISVIVPLGISGASGDINASGGIGASVGVFMSDSAEVGLATTLLMINVPRLNLEQEESLRTQQPLAEGASAQIPSSFRPVWMIGIYVAPKF